MTFYTDDISNGYDWKGFERAVARIMGHVGWKDTAVIGGADDKGCDILATREESNQVRSLGYSGQGCFWGSLYRAQSNGRGAVFALSFYGANVAAVATNGTFTKTAYLRREELEKNGYSLKLWNGAFLKGLIEKMPDTHSGFRELRPYQEKIVKKVIAGYENGDKRAFYIVATGLGKTVIVATIVRELWERGCRADPCVMPRNRLSSATRAIFLVTNQESSPHLRFL